MEEKNQKKKLLLFTTFNYDLRVGLLDTYGW